VYRGIDDYQHSWVLDPILRGVTGLEPRPDGLSVRPLPGLVREASVEGLVVCGRPVTVERRGDVVTMTIDGTAHEASPTAPVELAW
jgi:hypothetical protein